ncbi:phosphoenolpyruvate hydrolase family protein [Steroidobacter sp.]|uniref:phosphoenolpyruvate hydrolase family protein n=1 Tax=Steroidobacter sp. TaxID=1978227 RepID=UPI001A3A7776|nr:phosphoenolpyruvate hydrolase family protein [Steroidobacter sp.]MBL8269200.1 phosphoenolpyruvate hydrolase family protein [Steroidobacter sp.]
MTSRRQQLRERFLEVHARDEFLVGAAVGSGLFAEAAEHGRADFVLALNAGRLRLMGTASVACMLPIRDANTFVESFGPAEFLGRCSIPVFFGASAMSPDRSAADIARHVAELGFDGIMNFPSVVHYPDEVIAAMDRCGLGFRKELELLGAARLLDLWSVAHVRTRAQARQAATAGCDMICFDIGWTSGGRRGPRSNVTLSEAAMLMREIAKVVQRENPQTLLLLEGGPIESTEDLLPIYRAAHIRGYVGGSSIDRLPLEDAVINQTLRFKGAAAANRRSAEHDRELLELGKSLGVVGRSSRMIAFLQAANRFLRTSGGPAFVISGERGSRRQLTAEALFRLSGGDSSRLVTLDASEMSTQRMLMAIFGHADAGNRAARGAAARPDVPGLVIRGLEHVSKHIQRRIARFLARGRFRPVGGKRERTGALQVLFISSQPIARLFEQDTLDPELHRQLESRELCIPPLREHVEDLEEILNVLVAEISAGKHAAPTLSPAALRRLQTHQWPGNLAELRSFATRLLAADTGARVDERAVTDLLDAPMAKLPLPTSERDIILDALWRHGFHRGRTANFLGVCRKTLYNKISRYNLTG